MALSAPTSLAAQTSGTEKATTASFTPTAGALLLLLIVGWNGESASTITIEDTLGGLTWHPDEHENTTSQAHALIAWAWAPEAPSAGTVSAKIGVKSGSIAIQPFEVTGAAASPIGGTLQANGHEGSLSSAPAASSLVVALCGDATGGEAPSFSPLAGYTSLVASEHISPYQYQAAAYRLTGAEQHTGLAETKEAHPAVVAIEIKETTGGTVALSGSAAGEGGATGALKVLRRVRHPVTQTTDVTIRVQALDGTWETCGVDRAIRVVPESVQYNFNSWGPDKASFVLKRAPWAIWPDTGAHTPVEIEVGGVLCWKGEVNGAPFKAGAAQQISVQCQGLQYHLDDDSYRRTYVHSKLTDWKDCRSALDAQLGRYQSAPQVQVQQGSIVLGFPNESKVEEAVTTVGVFLDLGSAEAKRIVVKFGAKVFSGSWYTLCCRSAASVEDLLSASSFSEAFHIDPGEAENVTESGTFATAGRYVGIFIIRTKETNNENSDKYIKISSISVFSDTAYESGGESVLTASTVIEDAVKQATQKLSSDFSQIDPDGEDAFHIPDLAMSKRMTPREVIEAVNAYHNWVTMIDLYDRIVFEPLPKAPLLEIGAWSGEDIEDASAGDGSEIYNRAVATGSGPDGAIIEVERAAADVALANGAEGKSASGVAMKNSSFAANKEHWSIAYGTGTLTRDTTVYDTSPASLKVELSTSFVMLWGETEGTFHAGTPYTVSVRIKGSSGWATECWLVFGEYATVWGAGPAGLSVGGKITSSTSWQTLSVTWVPKEDCSTAVLDISLATGPATTLWVDSVEITAIEPTVVDRRGFQRTKTIEVSSAVTEAECQKLADTFLSGHMTTPYKGDVKAWPTDVRKVLSGQTVHPSQHGIYINELLRVSHAIDPDTGGVGRDGRLAGVSYEHASQGTGVSLDSRTDNFDAMLQRLAVVQGVGS